MPLTDPIFIQPYPTRPYPAQPFPHAACICVASWADDDGTTMGRFPRSPLTPKTSGGRRILRSHSRTGEPEQGQLPWIAYSLRDIRWLVPSSPVIGRLNARLPSLQARWLCFLRAMPKLPAAAPVHRTKQHPPLARQTGRVDGARALPYRRFAP